MASFSVSGVICWLAIAVMTASPKKSSAVALAAIHVCPVRAMAMRASNEATNCDDLVVATIAV